MTKRQVYAAVILLSATLMTSICVAQQPAEGESQSAKAKGEVPPQFYSIEFVLRELTDSKLVNTRNYTTNIGPGLASVQIRVGTRVPVPNGEKQFQYEDVGVGIDCSTWENRDARSLIISLNVTSVPSDAGQTAAPTIRKLSGSAVIPFTLDKPVLVTSIDDIGSSRKYQLEATIRAK